MTYIVEYYFYKPNETMKNCYISCDICPPVFIYAFENFPGISVGLISGKKYYKKYMNQAFILNYDSVYCDVL
jgi:hypothetical protein